MKGFAPQALILLPAQDKYNEYYGGYKAQFHAALDKLIAYLISVDTEPCFLLTDPVAMSIFQDRKDVRWVATENQGGLYFLKSNCGLQDVENLTPIAQSVIEQVDKKFPVERGLSVEQRWYLETKRVDLAERLLISQYQAVFLFGNQYTLRPKQDDGRALFFVNSQLVAKLKLSGNDANIASFLGIENANMSITEWRV